MRWSWRGWIAGTTLVAALVGCGSKKAESSETTTSTTSDVARRAPEASGSALSSPPSPASSAAPLELGVTGFLFVTYTPAVPTEKDVDAVKARVRTIAPGVALVDAPRSAKPPFAHVFATSGSEFSPPVEQELSYFARGLDDAAKARARASKGALATGWIVDRDEDHARLKAALVVARDTAKAVGGFVWDDTIRLLYTAESLDEMRIATWDGAVPDVRRHIAQHYYPVSSGVGGPKHRAVTLGMQCLGAPDLAIEDLPTTVSAQGGELMNVVAQLLVEGAKPDAKGDLTVDLAKVRHAGSRAAWSTPKSAPIVVRLTPTKPQDGDAENALLAITFPAFDAPSEGERQGMAAAKLFGADPDALHHAEADDAELLAIQGRAQKKLPELAKKFRAGLPVGAHISLKAPFETDDGNIEWMWVVVTDWANDAEIKGRLDNEPAGVKALHRGAPVTVKASAIADYVFAKADGTREGGESNVVLSRRQ